MLLYKKIAVVTAAGRGIGKAIAIAYAVEGASVVAVSNIESEVYAVNDSLSEIGSDSMAFCADITNVKDIANLVEAVKNKYGKIDILVNNAGVVGKRAFIQDADDAVWRNTIEVNLFGTYNCTKLFLPMMVKQNSGCIINIASISGKQPSPTNTAYSASKHAVIGLTKTLAAEFGWQKLRINVNAICPGVTNTEMINSDGMVLDELSRILGKSKDDILENFLKNMSSQHRILEPEEIANMAVFLATDNSYGITGQAINVCGGSTFY